MNKNYWVSDFLSAINVVFGALLGSLIGSGIGQSENHIHLTDITVSCAFLSVSACFIQVVAKFPTEKSGFKILIPLLASFLFAYLQHETLGRAIGQRFSDAIGMMMGVWLMAALVVNIVTRARSAKVGSDD